MWNFQERIRKGVEFARAINKKAKYFRDPLFRPCYFQGVLHSFIESHLQWISIFPEFPRQTWKLQWSIYKGISSTNLLVFFFLEQTTDSQTFFSGCWDTVPTALAWNIFLNLPKNKICYRLHPKYTSFSCFSIICS